MFEVVEAGEQGWGGAAFGDGFGEIVYLFLIGGNAGEQLTALILLFGGETSLTLRLDAHHFEDKSFSVDFLPQLFNHGFLKRFFGDASFGAFAAFAIGKGAEIGLILFVAVLAGRGTAIKRRSTAGAVGKA